MRRIILLIVIAILIFWVLSSPESAADVVQNIVAILRDAANAVIQFFTELF